MGAAPAHRALHTSATGSLSRIIHVRAHTWGIPVSVKMASVLASSLAPLTGLKNALVLTMWSRLEMLDMWPVRASTCLVWVLVCMCMCS